VIKKGNSWSLLSDLFSPLHNPDNRLGSSLPIKKQKLREEKDLAQGHTSNNWNWDENPGPSDTILPNKHRQFQHSTLGRYYLACLQEVLVMGLPEEEILDVLQMP
jgi:hypothetical protein